MKYIITNPEKQKADKKRLEEIAKERNISPMLLNFKIEKGYTIGDFLSERIELLNKSEIYKTVDKNALREEAFFSDNYINEFSSAAAPTFDFYARLSFDMSIRNNDNEWLDISRKSFSNAITAYEKQGKDIQGMNYLLNHLTTLREIVSNYFIKHNYSDSVDKILDYVNKLKEIKSGYKDVEGIKKKISETCQLIPQEHANKIDSLVNNILNGKNN